MNMRSSRAFGTESEERKKISEVCKPFRLASFAGGQALALVLLVQQRVKPLFDGFG
jgi:hypothetical protein